MKLGNNFTSVLSKIYLFPSPKTREIIWFLDKTRVKLSNFPRHHLRRVMRKGPGRHDTWFRVICIWNLRQDGGSLMVRTFKGRFLRFQLLFPDFYHFHHVIWGMKWAKMLKTKNGQDMSSGPFPHDAAQSRHDQPKRDHFACSTYQQIFRLTRST